MVIDVTSRLYLQSLDNLVAHCHATGCLPTKLASNRTYERSFRTFVVYLSVAFVDYYREGVLRKLEVGGRS